MSDNITFEDGRMCSLASSPLSWVLKDTAQHVSPEFQVWLNDVADRPNGFISFDVRGLAPHYRQQFYSALQLAFTIALSDPNKKKHIHNSRYLQVFQILLRTYKRSRRKLASIDKDDAYRADWDGHPIDLWRLWSCPTCGKPIVEQSPFACGNCNWHAPPGH